MLTDVFLKRVVLGILLILVGFVAGGVVYLKHLERQMHQQVAETAEVVKGLTPTPVKTETAVARDVIDTAESGHWHGNEWHAQPHTPVVEEDISPEPAADAALAAYEASLAHFTAEERATYDRVLQGNVKRHYGQYPDCQDHEAVWEDAARNAKWYIEKYKKWSEELDELHEEWERISHEKNEFSDRNYQNMLDMPVEERKAFVDNLTPEEAASLLVAFKDWSKRRIATFQRYDELYQEEPTEPKRRHTH